MLVTVTGYPGQLASEFKSKTQNDDRWIFLSINDLDITNEKKVFTYFNQNKTDYIINCAAYTNVDRAESEHESAFSVNCNAVKNLLEACKLNNIKLIHFSTDYVFNGKSKKAYDENDSTNPKGIYGMSKKEGEDYIINSNVKSLIIRTSWLYSTFGNNFVKTIIKISDKNEINIVQDQVGSPTYASDLADLTIKIINSNNYKWVFGEVFHFCNDGSCSWFEFANEIFKVLNINTKINPVSSIDFNSKVDRPKYSVLNNYKIKKTFDIEINDWKKSLYIMLSKL